MHIKQIIDSVMKQIKDKYEKASKKEDTKSRIELPNWGYYD
jgi:hypothetical protein